MSSELDDLLFEIERRAHGGARLLVGVAGPPGAGKSTLADRLHAALGERGHRSAVLPMDGFHLDNSILDERGDLPRKGAPHTFDVRGLADLLRAVKAGGEVFVPVFDRARELAIAAARCISPEDCIVIAEGNYLLLDQGPWADIADLFDLSVMVAPPIEELERRLIARWVGYGLTPAQIEAKVENNDLPNGRLVLQRSRPADFTFDQF
ncbi:MAG: nucleoside triphosphate hydrolase [Alphaproteobacteria bacterium]|nr:nucleoside triphosphate hydrolase [Alphaproteobacteria bacterium]